MLFALSSRLRAAVRGARETDNAPSPWTDASHGSSEWFVQHDHIHLITEADSRDGLARGMMGVTIRLARRLNTFLDRSGEVFKDRFHARVLKSAREVYLALRYVLKNVSYSSIWLCARNRGSDDLADRSDGAVARAQSKLLVRSIADCRPGLTFSEAQLILIAR